MNNYLFDIEQEGFIAKRNTTRSLRTRRFKMRKEIEALFNLNLEKPLLICGIADAF